MTIQEIHSYINNDSLPPLSKRFEVKMTIDKYPYFQAVVFIYLKMLYLAKDKMFIPELQKQSIFVTDRKALFYYILKEEYQQFFVQKGNKKDLGKSRTDILLNAFFETLDDESIDFEIDSLMAKDLQPMEYSDYFALVESESGMRNEPQQPLNTVPLKHQDIIDRFIKGSDENTSMRFSLSTGTENSTAQNVETNEEQLDEEMQDDLFFTETLASIYIKQQKYERAYEIIKRLSLNYPEKNLYFANQISFLEKLIINKKHKK